MRRLDNFKAKLIERSSLARYTGHSRAQKFFTPFTLRVNRFDDELGLLLVGRWDILGGAGGGNYV